MEQIAGLMRAKLSREVEGILRGYRGLLDGVVVNINKAAGGCLRAYVFRARVCVYARGSVLVCLHREKMAPGMTCVRGKRRVAERAIGRD